MLKLIADEQLDVIVNTFNDIYDNDEIPQEWLRSTFIPILKKLDQKSVKIIELYA